MTAKGLWLSEQKRRRGVARLFDFERKQRVGARLAEVDRGRGLAGRRGGLDEAEAGIDHERQADDQHGVGVLEYYGTTATVHSNDGDDRLLTADQRLVCDARLPEDQELAAASARIANLALPADVVVLGMGEDCHTASWLPRAEKLTDVISPGARQLVAAVSAPSAPEPRLTLTGRVVLRAKAIALHIEGESKLGALASALGPGPEDDMPIRAVLRGAGDRLTVFAAGRA